MNEERASVQGLTRSFTFTLLSAILLGTFRCWSNIYVSMYAQQLCFTTIMLYKNVSHFSNFWHTFETFCKFLARQLALNNVPEWAVNGLRASIVPALRGHLYLYL